MANSSTETVLVVDDNPATLYATSRVIRQAGFQVKEAGTGFEALEKAEHNCDLIVLDIDLPDIDGHEVCRRVRDNPTTARIPVVHVSATFVTDYHKTKGLEAGADGYLTHPVEPLVLIATIQAFLRTRHVENELSRSEAKFRAVFDQALMGICLISSDTIYLDANPAICRILGRSREEIIGKHCTAFARAGQERKFIQIVEHLERHDNWHGSLPLLHRDGHVVELEWSVSIHSSPGVLLAMVSDVTEQRRIEFEREQLLESERSARSAAERASRIKDEFLATLSHELRTPLNAIVGWSQILRFKPPSEKDLADGLEAIARNAKVQAELINDLLDVSKIMSGKLRLDIQTIDPAKIVHDALASVEPAAKAKGVILEDRLGPQSKPIQADPSRLQQVVWNLVNNAVKFTPKAGKVLIELVHSATHLEIRVSDTGQGIKPEFLSHLFERFRQEDATTTRTHGGLGLGLAIVKQLVELHGGTVEAMSDGEGMGALFIVRLPLAAVESSPEAHTVLNRTPATTPSLTDRPEFNLAGKRILVVDDDDDARILMTRVLKEFGADVRDAGSVAQALSVISGFKPDVLVSDIGMPVLDGYDLIRRVRSLGYTEESLPAIAVTAFARPEDRERVLRYGYQFHLGKPIAPSELIAAIAGLVAKRPN